MTYVAYLRQSTKKQEASGLGIEAQREIIHNFLSPEIPIAEFVETESGRHNDRPKLTEALALCRKTNSTLIVAKLDIIASIAEYEAQLISTRTKQSLEAKKARGVALGKPENLTDNLDKAISNSRKTNMKKARENPNNKRAVAMLRVLVKQNLSLTEMADILNSEGFVTSRGSRFTAWSVSILLKRYNLQHHEQFSE